VLNLLPKFLPAKSGQRQAELYRNLLRQEAKLGGELFGPLPSGHRREFFCLDRSTWVWHEEWTDQNGQYQAVTTRYTVRPNAILKSQGNSTYQQVGREEMRNLYRAAKLYREKVGSAYQQMLQVA
jgi:hypothetical protein